MATAAPRATDRRSIALLSAGHLFVDISQGAVPALLPFLIAERGYSYTAAGGLVLASTISSSLIQPLFGHFSDRRSLPWLMPAGVALAGLGISLAGLAPTYLLTFLAIVLSGLGVAAFHPEGSRFANYVSGSRRASGMSLFAVGGNAGVALGPVLFTPAVLVFGLSGTLVFIVPFALMAIVLGAGLGHLRGFRPDARETAQEREIPPAWGPFVRLSGVITFRTFVYFGLVTFVPLYFIRELGASPGAANAALALLLFGGAAGTLLGGPLADRVGTRPVLIGSMALVGPLVLAFWASGQALATALVFVVGAALIATFSVTLVMGQEYLPGRIGIASGVMLGLAIGLGGVGAPLFGAVADRFGLSVTMLVLAALPIPGALLALSLPREPRPATPDERGELAAMTDRATVDLLQRLDAEERAEGRAKW